MDIPASSTSVIILFGEVSKYGDGAKFSSYVGTNSEPVFLNLSDATDLVSAADPLPKTIFLLNTT
jgi:hypothetical protein